MELIKPEAGLDFTVTVEIQNTGSNDIYNAELNFIFIKNNDIVDTDIQSLNLESNSGGKDSVNFSNVPFKMDITYKAIASIYFENKLLDTKTITKQF